MLPEEKVFIIPSGKKKWVTSDYVLLALVIVGLFILLSRRPPPKPPPPPTYKTERKFLRYDTDKTTSTSFNISIQDIATQEGRSVFLVHLDKITETIPYKKEIWVRQRFKVYHDGTRELVSETEETGDTIRLEKETKIAALPNAEIDVTTNANLLKVGIVPRTNENGNAQIPFYSAKPFLEIEGTRAKDYGLTPKTQFLSEEKFRDYQTVPVRFSYKDSSIRKEISCYSLEKSIKDFIDSAINTKITSVRFAVEDIDSHAPISNPSIKIDGMPPAEEELLAPYFTGEYNAYATQFVKDYLRGTHEATTYESVMLYYPFSYVLEVIHPRYHFWKKKVYIDGSKNEYIIRMSELGTKIRGEITTR